MATSSPAELTGPRQLRFLKGIGERLALGIENARLYQQIQDTATLQERERIAREMHDGRGQVLGYVTTQTIADNGQGFDTAAVASGRSGFGLQTMRERAEAVGGSLAIDARPGQGTRVLVRIPRLRRGA